jgi:HAD superfamily hydrolase (TIGR01509 family)
MELKLPSGEFAAYLFDCDGTIADSMPLHYESWIQALSLWGCEFPKDLFYAWAGTPTIRVVDRLNEKYGLQMSPEEVVEEKEKAYLKTVSSIQPISGVLRHIEAQSGRIPFAVVSGSPRDSVIQTLSALNLLSHFPVILGAEDYRQGKPHPEAFLLAAQSLGVPSEQCLVFEDADLGIEAAISAGMSWVKVPQSSF